MDKKMFLDNMVDLMDTEQELHMDTVLSDIAEWDSLSYVAFMAYCNHMAGKKVNPKEVKTAKTIYDLYVLFGGRD